MRHPVNEIIDKMEDGDAWKSAFAQYIDDGGDVNHPNVFLSSPHYGKTLLIRAIELKSISIVKKLMDVRVNVNVPHAKTGQTPLSYLLSNESIDQSSTSICKMLIDNGVDVNKVDDYTYMSPLYHILSLQYPYNNHHALITRQLLGKDAISAFRSHPDYVIGEVTSMDTPRTVILHQNPAFVFLANESQPLTTDYYAISQFLIRKTSEKTYVQMYNFFSGDRSTRTLDKYADCTFFNHLVICNGRVYPFTPLTYLFSRHRRKLPDAELVTHITDNSDARLHPDAKFLTNMEKLYKDMIGENRILTHSRPNAPGNTSTKDKHVSPLAQALQITPDPRLIYQTYCNLGFTVLNDILSHPTQYQDNTISLIRLLFESTTFQQHYKRWVFYSDRYVSGYFDYKVLEAYKKTKISTTEGTTQLLYDPTHEEKYSHSDRIIMVKYDGWTGPEYITDTDSDAELFVTELRSDPFFINVNAMCQAYHPSLFTLTDENGNDAVYTNHGVLHQLLHTNAFARHTLFFPNGVGKQHSIAIREKYKRDQQKRKKNKNNNSNSKNPEDYYLNNNEDDDNDDSDDNDDDDDDDDDYYDAHFDTTANITDDDATKWMAVGTAAGLIHRPFDEFFSIIYELLLSHTTSLHLSRDQLEVGRELMAAQQQENENDGDDGIRKIKEKKNKKKDKLINNSKDATDNHNFMYRASGSLLLAVRGRIQPNVDFIEYLIHVHRATTTISMYSFHNVLLWLLASCQDLDLEKFRYLLQLLLDEAGCDVLSVAYQHRIHQSAQYPFRPTGGVGSIAGGDSVLNSTTIHNLEDSRMMVENSQLHSTSHHRTPAYSYDPQSQHHSVTVNPGGGGGSNGGQGHHVMNHNGQSSNNGGESSIVISRVQNSSNSRSFISRITSIFNSGPGLVTKTLARQYSFEYFNLVLLYALTSPRTTTYLYIHTLMATLNERMMTHQSSTTMSLVASRHSIALFNRDHLHSNIIEFHPLFDTENGVDKKHVSHALLLYYMVFGNLRLQGATDVYTFLIQHHPIKVQNYHTLFRCFLMLHREQYFMEWKGRNDHHMAGLIRHWHEELLTLQARRFGSNILTTRSNHNNGRYSSTNPRYSGSGGDITSPIPGGLLTAPLSSSPNGHHHHNNPNDNLEWDAYEILTNPARMHEFLASDDDDNDDDDDDYDYDDDIAQRRRRNNNNNNNNEHDEEREEERYMLGLKLHPTLLLTPRSPLLTEPGYLFFDTIFPDYWQREITILKSHHHYDEEGVLDITNTKNNAYNEQFTSLMTTLLNAIVNNTIFAAHDGVWMRKVVERFLSITHNDIAQHRKELNLKYFAKNPQHDLINQNNKMNNYNNNNNLNTYYVKTNARVVNLDAPEHTTDISLFTHTNQGINYSYKIDCTKLFHTPIPITSDIVKALTALSLDQYHCIFLYYQQYFTQTCISPYAYTIYHSVLQHPVQEELSLGILFDANGNQITNNQLNNNNTSQHQNQQNNNNNNTNNFIQQQQLHHIILVDDDESSRNQHIGIANKKTIPLGGHFGRYSLGICTQNDLIGNQVQQPQVISYCSTDLRSVLLTTYAQTIEEIHNAKEDISIMRNKKTESFLRYRGPLPAIYGLLRATTQQAITTTWFKAFDLLISLCKDLFLIATLTRTSPLSIFLYACLVFDQKALAVAKWLMQPPINMQEVILAIQHARENKAESTRPRLPKVEGCIHAQLCPPPPNQRCSITSYDYQNRQAQLSAAGVNQHFDYVEALYALVTAPAHRHNQVYRALLEKILLFIHPDDLNLLSFDPNSVLTSMEVQQQELTYQALHQRTNMNKSIVSQYLSHLSSPTQMSIDVLHLLLRAGGKVHLANLSTNQSPLIYFVQQQQAHQNTITREFFDIFKLLFNNYGHCGNLLLTNEHKTLFELALSHIRVIDDIAVDYLLFLLSTSHVSFRHSLGYPDVIQQLKLLEQNKSKRLIAPVLSVDRADGLWSKTHKLIDTAWVEQTGNTSFTLFTGNNNNAHHHNHHRNGVVLPTTNQGNTSNNNNKQRFTGGPPSLTTTPHYNNPEQQQQQHTTIANKKKYNPSPLTRDEFSALFDFYYSCLYLAPSARYYSVVHALANHQNQHVVATLFGNVPNHEDYLYYNDRTRRTSLGEVIIAALEARKRELNNYLAFAINLATVDTIENVEPRVVEDDNNNKNQQQDKNNNNNSRTGLLFRNQHLQSATPSTAPAIPEWATALSDTMHLNFHQKRQKATVFDGTTGIFWYILNNVQNPSTDDIITLVDGLKDEQGNLLSTPVSIEHVNSNSETTLMHAILRRWNPDTLKFLIQKIGPEVVMKQKDNNGRTAYDYMVACCTHLYAPDAFKLLAQLKK